MPRGLRLDVEGARIKRGKVRMGLRPDYGCTARPRVETHYYGSGIATTFNPEMSAKSLALEVSNRQSR